MNHCLEFTSAEFFFWLPSSKQEPITRHRIAIRRTIPLVPAVAALAIACAETVAPLPDSSGWSVIAAEIVAIPCVVATAHNGTVRTLAIGRDELPIPLPSLDSVRGSPGSKPVLVTAVTQMLAGDASDAQSFSVACLISSQDERDGVLVDALQTAGWTDEWRQVVGRVGKSGRLSDANELMAASILQLRGELQSLLSAETDRATGTTYTLEMDDPYELPPIWVFVSPTAFIIDAHSTWAEAKRRWDYQTAPKVRYEYTGSQCTEASEFYLAQYEILDSMSDLGSFMGAMANTLEPLVCDIVPGKPLCVDLFIANSRALVFGGDDRTFNPEAGIDNSRVHLYINPETLEFEVAINRTIMYLAGHVLVDSLSLFDPGQDIKVLPTPGGFMVEATFLNNFCQWRSLCPTIDIELFFNENSSKPGGYDAYWVRDGFPSMGIYVRSDDNQSWHTLAEDPERIKSAWLNWLALKDGFLQNVNLPPGCNVQ